MESKISDKSFELSVLGALVIAIGVYIIENILSIPFGILSESMYVNSHKVLKLVIGVLEELVPKGLTIMFILKIVREDFKADFKIKYIEKFNLKLLLCTIFLILGFFLCFQSSIGIMIRKIPSSEFVAESVKKIVKTPYLMAILFIIIGPIFEEILMRGIILEGFLNKYKASTAIIISSIIFGVMHLNLPQSINATIMGVICGIIYYKTRSLALCIVAHMVNNTICVLGVQLNIISFFVGAVIFITSVIFFQRYIKELKYVDTNISITDNLKG